MACRDQETDITAFAKYTDYWTTKKTLQMQGYIQQPVLSQDNTTLEVSSKLYTEISVSIAWDLVAKTITAVTRKILLVS